MRYRECGDRHNPRALSPQGRHDIGRVGPLLSASCALGRAHCLQGSLLECSELPTWRLPVLAPPRSDLHREQVLIHLLPLRDGTKSPTQNCVGASQSLLVLDSLGTWGAVPLLLLM